MVLALCPTEFDCHVPAIDVAGFAQPFLESGDEMSESGGGPAVEEPNHRQRLLRPRREGPYRCRIRTTYPCNEIASSHSIPQAQIRPRSLGFCSGHENRKLRPVKWGAMVVYPKIPNCV